MRVIDLSMTIHEGMTSFPSPVHTRPEITQLGRIGFEGRETRRITMGTHTGTHVDAPRHFIEMGAGIDEISVNQLIGEAVMFDLRHLRGDPMGVTDQDICNSPVPLTGRAAVLRFDWDDHLGSSAYYQNFPYLSASAVRYLVSSGCRMVAMDTPSPDRMGDSVMPAHKILMNAGIIIVEYLVNLRSIKSTMFDLFVAPLKIKGGDGAPARVFAVDED